MNMTKISEKVADQYAVEFLTEYAGNEIFIGNDIENILAEKATVIYQAVDDPEYYGAAIHLMNKSFIAINTRQALRMRYYSAAHELWHLQYELDKIPLAEIPDFKHERAADHFAAAVMMPERLVRGLIKRLSGGLENQIIKVADISSMPYVAVVRRLQELKKQIPKAYSERSEEDWVSCRRTLGISPSFLDKADILVQFTALANEVDRLVKEQKITLEVAANLLKHPEPEQAERYWQQRKTLIDDERDTDDE